MLLLQSTIWAGPLRGLQAQKMLCACMQRQAARKQQMRWRARLLALCLTAAVAWAADHEHSCGVL